MTEAEKELTKGLKALYLAADECVADDINRLVNARIKELQEEVKALYETLMEAGEGLSHASYCAIVSSVPNEEYIKQTWMPIIKLNRVFGNPFFLSKEEIDALPTFAEVLNSKDEDEDDN